MTQGQHAEKAKVHLKNMKRPLPGVKAIVIRWTILLVAFFFISLLYGISKEFVPPNALTGAIRGILIFGFMLFVWNATKKIGVMPDRSGAIPQKTRSAKKSTPMKQKIILLATASVLVLMFLFPPFHLVTSRGTLNRGYGFIFNSIFPQNRQLIALERLSVQRVPREKFEVDKAFVGKRPPTEDEIEEAIAFVRRKRLAEPGISDDPYDKAISFVRGKRPPESQEGLAVYGPPKDPATVDTGTLLVQCLIVVVVGAVCWFAFRDKE